MKSGNNCIINVVYCAQIAFKIHVFLRLNPPVCMCSPRRTSQKADCIYSDQLAIDSLAQTVVIRLIERPYWAYHNSCTQSSTELTNTALNEIDQSPQISVTQRRGLEKWSRWTSWGSRWANTVKLNAYYKEMKVLFDLACMSICCWRLLKPKLTFHNP